MVDGWKLAWVCADLDLSVVAWWLTVENGLGLADLGLGLPAWWLTVGNGPRLADLGLGWLCSTMLVSATVEVYQCSVFTFAYICL